jgi:hypothetical protein
MLFWHKREQMIKNDPFVNLIYKIYNRDSYDRRYHNRSGVNVVELFLSVIYGFSNSARVFFRLG